MISKEEFKKEVITLGTEVGVNPKEIHFRKMKRKWASCSSKGRLTFDYALLSEEREERYRVILHELLHLKYPTHGKMFNTMLETYLKKSLKDHRTPAGSRT